MSFETVAVKVDALGRMDRKNAAVALGKSEQTLANWSVGGEGPQSFKINGRVSYWAAEIEAYGRGDLPPGL